MKRPISEQDYSHAFDALIRGLRTDLDKALHRQLLIVSGEREWALHTAQDLITNVGYKAAVLIGDRETGGYQTIEAAKAEILLGRETDAVIFDGFAGLDGEALGAVSGTIRGGGVLVLLMPRLAEWLQFTDPDARRMAVALHDDAAIGHRFLQRLSRLVSAGVPIIEQGKPPPILPQTHAIALPEFNDPACRTVDQRMAVEAIIKVVTGHRRRPLVLMSDRGRGKSAALGIAAAQLLQQGLQRIIVTAPRLVATETVFAHAGRLLPEALVSRAALHYHAAHLRFMAPDELLRENPTTDLLLVDEAAAIPAPILIKVLERYSRIVFATTVHGYEGTGRGFAVRFQRVLDECTPQWRLLRLETPIRWAPDDPLEQWLFKVLLLNAVPVADEAVIGLQPGQCMIECLDRDALVEDEATLAQIFGLLVLAHYRTRPSDLRYLLDGPNVSVYAMRHGEQVIATALLVREGGFNAQQAQAIWAGATRPHGHLLPESLAVHVGLEQAPQLRSARVMRIAVHPALQRRGFGARLVSALIEAVAADGLDYVGCDFGATPELLRFWQQAGFQSVRVSSKRGHASGAHAVLMLRPLSAAGQDLYREARRRFHAIFLHQLADPLRDLESELAGILLRDRETDSAPVLTEHEWCEVAGFADGQRLYEASLPALWKLTQAALADVTASENLSSAQRGALILKLLQKQPWSKTAQAVRVPGREDVLVLLRSAVATLLKYY